MIAMNYFYSNFTRFASRCSGRRNARAASGGFTVVETAVAGALLTLFLASLFSLNSLAVRMLHSATETVNASQELQTRVEQVRLANWLQITNSASFCALMAGQLTDAAIDTGAMLPGMVEYITVAPVNLPAGKVVNLTPTSGTPTAPPGGFVVTCSGYNATAATDSGAATLPDQEVVQVNITITWPSWGRQRTRSACTLVSKWGISK